MRLPIRQFLVLLLPMTVLVGCATYGDQLEQARSLVAVGEYDSARDRLDGVLAPSGDDRLLYHLEHGAVAHMAGNYRESIRLFAEAEQIGEALFTRRLRDSLRSAFSSPRNTPYRGSDYELAYLHYYQALNYLALAQDETGRDRRSLLDEALVEARQLDARLDELSLRYGEYEQADSGDDDARIFAGLYRGFDPITAEAVDPSRLRFREGAWLRYLSGVLYEMAGEGDNARIAYRRAAELYESGYADQYGLGEGIVRQAWQDAYRLTRQIEDGGRRERLARERLGEDTLRRLQADTGDRAQVVVIQHVNHLPPRDELTLYLVADPWQRSIRLAPWTGGDPETRRAQAAWFQLMYTDTGPLAMLLHFSQGGLPGAFHGAFEKRFYLGPLWDNLADWGVTDALRGGMRVSVPYPGPPPERPPSTRVRAGGQSHSLLPADDLAMMSHQALLREAGSLLREAVARRVFQNVLAERLARELEEEDNLLAQILALFTRAGVSMASEADTRNWQLLPAQVRVARFSLPPGEHELQLDHGEFTGRPEGATASRRVTLDAGETRVLFARRVADTAKRQP